MKTDPQTVRFEHQEQRWLSQAASLTGLPIAELVRRSVRLMQREIAQQNSYSLLITLPSVKNRPHHHTV